MEHNQVFICDNSGISTWNACKTGPHKPLAGDLNPAGIIFAGGFLVYYVERLQSPLGLRDVFFGEKELAFFSHLDNINAYQELQGTGFIVAQPPHSLK